MRARAQVAKVLSKAMDKFGRLDGVVNCTGNMTMKPAHLTGEEEFMEGLRINALSSFNILGAAVREPASEPAPLACACAACPPRHPSAGCVPVHACFAKEVCNRKCRFPVVTRSRAGRAGGAADEERRRLDRAGELVGGVPRLRQPRGHLGRQGRRQRARAQRGQLVRAAQHPRQRVLAGAGARAAALARHCLPDLLRAGCQHGCWCSPPPIWCQAGVAGRAAVWTAQHVAQGCLGAPPDQQQ